MSVLHSCTKKVKRDAATPIHSLFPAVCIASIREGRRLAVSDN